MDFIELTPALCHCIETTVREEFWNSVNQYLRTRHEDRILEAKIELLKAFLESVDFTKLRGRSERYLVEGKSVSFMICWKDGELSHEMVLKGKPPRPGENPQSHLPQRLHE